MTIKHILNKINIHISTYIIILLSFLAGYFEVVFLTMFFITFHELGHYITGKLLNLKVSRVDIYLFGGVTIFEEDLNLDIKKEIITLIMGPIFQILLFILIYFLYNNGYVNTTTYEKVYIINKYLLTFNLLPILPLDGGKLLNNILDIILPYDLSHKITIIISIITLPIIFTFDNKLISILITLFLIIKIIEEIEYHKYRLNKLILERKLKNIKFKKTIEVTNIKKIKRNKNIIIKNT